MAKQQAQQPKQVEPKRKIGQGMAAAALRQGAKELAHITDAFPQGTPTVDEPGTMFNTPITGVSQQTGFAQPVKSAVDQHHSQMIGTAHGQAQDKTVDDPQQQVQTQSPQTSVIDQHHSQMTQGHDQQQPQMEIEK